MKTATVAGLELGDVANDVVGAANGRPSIATITSPPTGNVSPLNCSSRPRPAGPARAAGLFGATSLTTAPRGTVKPKRFASVGVRSSS